MFKSENISTLMEARIEETEARGGTAIDGRRVFVRELYETLGLHEDNYGRLAIAPNSASPQEFSLRELAEGICGYATVKKYFDPANRGDCMSLLEAGPGIDPTAFVNINTFSLAVAGLLSAEIISRFQNPDLIGDKLVTVRATKHNGEKLVGVTGVGNKSKPRGIGEPHARAAFGEQWVKTQETVEQALAMEVSQEAVFFDYTGDVLDVAGGIGDELAYARELAILKTVLGITNTYNYKDTTYNTYLAAADSGPWINKQANVFTDWTSIDTARRLFTKMKDPATAKEILVRPTLAIIDEGIEGLFAHTLTQTSFQERTNRSTDVGVRVTTGENPLNRIMPNLQYVQSPIVHNLLLDNGVSEANTVKRWWLGDFKKGFRWMENWPLRVRQANAQEAAMMDRGIIAGYYADYRGGSDVIEPRYASAQTE